MPASSNSSSYCIYKMLNTLVGVNGEGNTNYNKSFLMDTGFLGPIHKYILR